MGYIAHYIGTGQLLTRDKKMTKITQAEFDRHDCDTEMCGTCVAWFDQGGSVCRFSMCDGSGVAEFGFGAVTWEQECACAAEQTKVEFTNVIEVLA